MHISTVLDISVNNNIFKGTSEYYFDMNSQGIYDKNNKTLINNTIANFFAYLKPINSTTLHK